MLGTLLAKDLRRTWRNPIPWVILFAIPFAIAGIIGLAFGPGGGGPQMRIRIALVDEDQSPLTEFLHGLVNRMQSQENQGLNLQVELLDRTAALDRLTNNEISAAVIIPKGFTNDYFAREKPVTLELVKNPAQGVPPALIEEGLAIVTTGLNALSRVAGDQFETWKTAFEDTEDSDVLEQLARWSQLLISARDLLKPARDYLAPPLVVYTKELRAAGPPASGTTGGGSVADVFAFLMVGLSGMFLLMLADNAMRDLYREMRFRTLERFSTLREGLTVFVASKVVFSLAVLLIGALILFGGSSLIFGVVWKRLPELMALIVSYAFFAAGFMGLLAALAGTERRADVINIVVIMILSMGGGCMFPPATFPPVWREHFMPLLPTAWFAAPARALQYDPVATGWIQSTGLLAGCGVTMIVLAGWLFRRRLQKGGGHA